MRMDGQTDRQTDVTRLTVAFRNFVNASKNTVFCDVTLQSARNLGIFLEICGLYFHPEDGQYIPLKLQVRSSEMSPLNHTTRCPEEKRLFFVTTAETTSNLTFFQQVHRARHFKQQNALFVFGKCPARNSTRTPTIPKLASQTTFGSRSLGGYFSNYYVLNS